MTAGTLVFVGGISPGADAGIVTIPMLLLGLGIGALASQLGAVTVSAVPDNESPEVGGLQNTVTNLGASLGTALVGAVLFATLTTGLVRGIEASSAIPADVKTQATTQLSGGVPLISDSDLRAQLEAAKCSRRASRCRGEGEQRCPLHGSAHLIAGCRARRHRRPIRHRNDPRQAGRAAGQQLPNQQVRRSPRAHPSRSPSPRARTTA